MTSSVPVLPARTTIQAAIRKIELGHDHTAFVVDERGAFLGQVSLQQLRRLILSGTDGSSAIAGHAGSAALRIEKARARDKDLLASLANDMEMQGVEALPVITPRNRVAGALKLSEIRRMLSKAGARRPAARPAAVQNVLIVGGAGYLGSVLTRKLLARGRFVRVLDSFIYGKRSLAELSGHRHLDVIEGDFRDIPTVVNSLKDIDAVILLAAVVGDPAAHVRPIQTIETNILAAQSLAFACKLHCISRFVFASTCSVYGRTDDVLDENAPLNPVSLYARSKIFSERCILDLAGDNFSPTILRMGTLYGPSPRMRFDLVVNTMSMKAHEEKRIQVFGGSQWRPLLHVADAAEAFALCLDAPLETIGNQIFNVGSDRQNYQIRTIAGLISRALKGVPVEVEGASLDARDYRVSFDKIQSRLRFRPSHSIPLAAREIVKDLRLGRLRHPYAKVYYNHYFDATEES